MREARTNFGLCPLRRTPSSTSRMKFCADNAQKTKFGPAFGKGKQVFVCVGKSVKTRCR